MPVRFAAILSRALGPEDVAARLGGEEFCLLVHSTSAAAVHALAEAIRLEFAGTDPLPGDFGPPTVSAGIAIASPRPETFDALLHAAADELLYRAKDARPQPRPRPSCGSLRRSFAIGLHRRSWLGSDAGPGLLKASHPSESWDPSIHLRQLRVGSQLSLG